MQTTYGTGYRTSSTEAAVIATERTMPLAGTRQGVIYGHGALQTGIALFQSQYINQPQALTESGYPFIAADLGNLSGSNWGNDDEITAITAAYNALTSAGAKSGKVCLFGVSMGGLLLNWAVQNASKVTAIFLNIPAGNLNDIYTNNKGSYQAAIGTAYGVTYPTALPNLATHSPLDYGSTQLTALAGIPIQIWASDNDPIAMTTSVCQTWAASIGSNVTVHSLGAQGHSEAGSNPLNIVSFFDANGGRS